MSSLADGRDGGKPLRAAAVVGVAGLSLEEREADLIQEARPLGLILFKRNCADPGQVTALIQAFRQAVGDPKAPVLIDQEGGRVTRLKPPHWRASASFREIGALSAHDLDAAKEAAWRHARLIAADLWPLGVTINCSPVLDLGLPSQTEAIGDRAFSDDPGIVSVLGRSTIEGYLAGGVLPVIKHLPGHGRAMVDSHALLPCVEAETEVLARADWKPFRDNADAPLGMTAHILFPALDQAACATQSSAIVNDVIRGEIGFAGVLFSDDLSMQALGGSLGERAALARKAGCDIALHCNGDLDEMTEVLAAAGPLEGESLHRVERALAAKKAPEPFDRDLGRERLDALLSAAPQSREARS